MIKKLCIFIFKLGLVLVSLPICAQEEEPKVEESSEVYLDEYSDNFQETFFEALKQKGIENYDKATVLLLKCKQLDSDNSTIDHELAKTYFGDKKYIQAQEYAIEALLVEPENFWYLNTLVEILQAQGGSIENVRSKIPMDNVKLKENLALIFFRQKKYDAAQMLINGLKNSSFKEELSLKINDSIQKGKIDFNVGSVNSVDKSKNDPIEEYRKRIDEFISTNSIASLDKLSAEALENYPSYPFFYYAQGYALNQRSKYMEAVDILETALDYLLDDVSLANKIYQELANAYTALDNISKANMYLRRLKPGF